MIVSCEHTESALIEVSKAFEKTFSASERTADVSVDVTLPLATESFLYVFE